VSQAVRQEEGEEKKTGIADWMGSRRDVVQKTPLFLLLLLSSCTSLLLLHEPVMFEPLHSISSTQ
jgi:hypothetical protein